MRRDACPGVVDPMPAGDGWLARVRLPGGAVSAVQLRALADIARAHGSGTVEITSRANLQVRGLRDESRGPAADVLIDCGLADADRRVDARRAIVAPALAGHDPTELADVTPMVRSITAALAVAEFADALPPKFSVVVDGGGRAGVADLAGDVVVAVDGDTASLAWSSPAPPGAGPPNPELVCIADLPDAVVRIAAELGVARSNGRRSARCRVAQPRDFAGPIVGIHADHDEGRCTVVAAPRFGRLDPNSLLVLAELADSAELRFTHRRGVAVVGVRTDDVADLIEVLDRGGLSADAADPGHSVTACVGTSGCISARGDSLAAAGALVIERRRHLAPWPPVHFAGCEKHCGAPKHADLWVADDNGAFALEDTNR